MGDHMKQVTEARSQVGRGQRWAGKSRGSRRGGKPWSVRSAAYGGGAEAAGGLKPMLGERGAAGQAVGSFRSRWG